MLRDLPIYFVLSLQILSGPAVSSLGTNILSGQLWYGSAASLSAIRLLSIQGSSHLDDLIELGVLPILGAGTGTINPGGHGSVTPSSFSIRC